MRKGFDLICLSEIFAVHWLSGPENGTRDSWVGSAIASPVLCSPLWRLNIWKHPENQRNLDAPQIKQRNNEFFVSPIIVRKKNCSSGNLWVGTRATGSAGGRSPVVSSRPKPPPPPEKSGWSKTECMITSEKSVCKVSCQLWRRNFHSKRAFTCWHLT